MGILYGSRFWAEKSLSHRPKNSGGWKSQEELPGIRRKICRFDMGRKAKDQNVSLECANCTTATKLTFLWQACKQSLGGTTKNTGVPVLVEHGHPGNFGIPNTVEEPYPKGSKGISFEQQKNLFQIFLSGVFLHVLQTFFTLAFWETPWNPCWEIWFFNNGWSSSTAPPGCDMGTFLNVDAIGTRWDPTSYKWGYGVAING